VRTAYSTPLARAALALLLSAAGCGTARLYEGAPRTASEVATIYVGGTIVRAVDGAPRRGGAFDAEALELPPGPHQLTLVFELPARTIGIRALPAQEGIGTCVLSFDTVAGHQYYLVARAHGEIGSRWDGSWEAWVRDPAVAHENDIIARCNAIDPNLAAKPGAHGAAAAASAPPGTAPAATAPAAPQSSPASAAPAAAPVAEPAAPHDTRPLRVGTWNLRSFGRLPGKDMARIATAIEAHVDVLALTELSGDGGPAALQRLLAPLGLGWGAMLGPLPHPPANQMASEYTAILYRRDRVRPCEGWDRLRELTAAAATAILRPPAVGCFTTAPAGQAGPDFLLAAYHASSADGDAGLVAQEVAQLDAVFAAMAAARPGERTLIIAGDFNLEPNELASVSHGVAPGDGGGSVLDLLGERTSRRTDHLLFRDSDAAGAVIGVATPIDLRGASPADYYRVVSDHLPIVLQLRVEASDPD
jgi:hypothetical protein